MESRLTQMRHKFVAHLFRDTLLLVNGNSFCVAGAVADPTFELVKGYSWEHKVNKLRYMAREAIFVGTNVVAAGMYMAVGVVRGV